MPPEMTLARLLLLLMLGPLLASCASQELKNRRQAARAAAESEAARPRDRVAYRITPGDSLRIEHPFNDELNRAAVVRPDGYITLPLIGDLQVADRTPAEARALIEERYTGTVRTPRVTLAVDNAANQKVCVGGEVVNPGMFPLSEGLTALRAVALAGGPRGTARMRSVVVLRDRGGREPQYLLVNLHRASDRLSGEGDLRLQAKDMIFVPRTTIATMDAFVDQYLNQLIPFSKNLGVTYFIGRGVY